MGKQVAGGLAIEAQVGPLIVIVLSVLLLLVLGSMAVRRWGASLHFRLC